MRFLAAPCPRPNLVFFLSLVLVLVACARAPVAAAGVVVQVEGSIGNDTTCAVSGGPCQTLARGLEVAGVNGTVVVGPGVYRGAGNCNVTVRQPGMTLVSSHGPAVTFVDCEQLSRCLVINGVVRVTVEGFTFANGVAAPLKQCNHSRTQPLALPQARARQYSWARKQERSARHTGESDPPRESRLSQRLVLAVVALEGQGRTTGIRMLKESSVSDLEEAVVEVAKQAAPAQLEYLASLLLRVALSGHTNRSNLKSTPGAPRRLPTLTVGANQHRKFHSSASSRPFEFSKLGKNAPNSVDVAWGNRFRRSTPSAAAGLTEFGGCILGTASDVALLGCVIVNCTAPFGGGVALLNTNAVLHAVTIVRNSAQEGGGVWAQGGTLGVTACVVSGNTVVNCGPGTTPQSAGAAGGGMYVFGSILNVASSQ